MSTLPNIPNIPVAEDVIRLIGNTPLIKLRRASEETGCEIYGKAEFLNPGQSVKDRAALSIIEAAERSGALQPGGLIVEATAGNTGIGLSLVARAKGYRTAIVIPETQSAEKKDALRLMGAELIEVPAVPYRNPNNYIKLSGRLAEQLRATEPNGVLWANQFDNVANRQAHVVGTGPELVAQLGEKLDGFICACGSGGTLSGVAEVLREKIPGVKIGLADPGGANLYSYYTEGELKSEGNSISEGIGQGRITANLEGFKPDFAYRLDDVEGLKIIYDLLWEEGLCMGLSTGINIAGAKRMAEEMGAGHTIVTILCDYGNRYQSKIYNPAFLREKGLPVPGWMEGGHGYDLPFEEVDA
ncbi:MAG: cysteine synthase A [Pseudomonadota bacterium]